MRKRYFKIALKHLKPGTHFRVYGVEYIKLDDGYKHTSFRNDGSGLLSHVELDKIVMVERESNETYNV